DLPVAGHTHPRGDQGDGQHAERSEVRHHQRRLAEVAARRVVAVDGDEQREERDRHDHGKEQRGRFPHDPPQFVEDLHPQCPGTHHATSTFDVRTAVVGSVSPTTASSSPAPSTRRSVSCLSRSSRVRSNRSGSRVPIRRCAPSRRTYGWAGSWRSSAVPSRVLALTVRSGLRPVSTAGGSSASTLPWFSTTSRSATVAG